MLRLCVIVCSLGACALAQNAATYQWINQVDSSGADTVAGLGVDAVGNSYVAGTTYSFSFPLLNSLQQWSKPSNIGYGDVFVTKLDPSGNLLYSTLFGGTGNDVATAMAVDSSGNVYVTGTTSSTNFPVTPGTYASSGASFVFKLNPDGSLGYSTYFAPLGPSENPTANGNVPAAIAVDSAGSVYIAGSSNGGVPITAGAYQPACTTPPPIGNGPFSLMNTCGFASKLDSTGSKLLYSTFVPPVDETFGLDTLIASLAVGRDGTAYLGGSYGIYHLSADGSALLATTASSFDTKAAFVPSALAVAADGSLYAAGHASTFPTTAGAFETSLAVAPLLPEPEGSLAYAPSPNPAVIARWDSQLANILDATYFGGGRSNSVVYSVAFDSNGNVYLSGATDQQGLLTRAPLQMGFAVDTGFVSELSGDLSTLLFSSYFGDSQNFNIAGIGVRADATLVLGGYAFKPDGDVAGSSRTRGGSLWVNSLTLTPAPALHVDSVVNAASLLDGPMSAGETIVVQGVGFGTHPQLSIGGIAVPAISTTPGSITAIVPLSLAGSAATVVQVSSAGEVSNPLPVAVALTAPGVFSQDGSGFNQGYILNNDGTLNTPANPAAPGAAISVFATGVGPISTIQGYAVSQYPVDVYIAQILCDGIEAFTASVPGFPGNVYQIQVFVPSRAELAVFSAPQKTYPSLLLLNMIVNGIPSQSGIAFSVTP